MNGVLFVEGRDDIYVISFLAEGNGIPESFTIHDSENDAQAMSAFKTFLKGANYQGLSYKGEKLDFAVERLGIVIDANGSRDSKWQQLKKQGHTCPEVLDENGLHIVDEEQAVSHVGVWLMPDNVSAGMIETFFKDFIPSDDPLKANVETFINSLPEEPKPRPKAEVRTWLACQTKSESMMGRFLQKNKTTNLNLNNDLATKFVAWLKQVFSDQ